MRTLLARLVRWSDVRLVVLVGLSIVAFYSARIFALALRFDFQCHGEPSGLRAGSSCFHRH